MKAIVTGGAGFIGSHIVDRYNDGTEVSILDGHIFLESLKHTESSFKIKLFVS